MQTELIKDADALSAMTREELAVQVAVRKGLIIKPGYPEWYMKDEVPLQIDGVRIDRWLDGNRMIELLDEIQTIETQRVCLEWFEQRDEKFIYALRVTNCIEFHSTVVLVYHADRVCCVARAWIYAFDKGLMPNPEANNA